MMSDAADGLAREVIEAAGYKEAFGHSLGHGVGLAVHENPSLSPMKERAVALAGRHGQPPWNRASTCRIGAECAWRT